MNDKEQLDLEFQISRYLDGQLSDRQAAELEKRIQSDPNLGRLMDRYAAIASHVSDMSLDESEFNFAEQKAEIMRSVERKMLLGGARRRIVLRPFVRIAAAAAVILIVSAVAFWMLQPAPQPDETIEVALMRSEPLPTGEIVMDIELVLLSWDEIDLASQDEAVSPELPAGTIVVSIGAANRPQTDFLLPM